MHSSLLTFTGLLVAGTSFAAFSFLFGCSGSSGTDVATDGGAPLDAARLDARSADAAMMPGVHDAAAALDAAVPLDAAPPIDAGPTDDAAAPADGGPCTKRWSILAYARPGYTTAAVTPNGLVLSTTATLSQFVGSNPGFGFGVYQDGITGDFDATLVVDSVSSAEGNPGVLFFVGQAGADPNSGLDFFKYGSADNVGFTMGGNPPGGAGYGVPDPVGATLRITRTGNSIHMEGDFGGQMDTTTDGFGADPLRIGILLTSSAIPNANPGVATIRSFKITGGGGTVTSDDFSCDSLVH